MSDSNVFNEYIPTVVYQNRQLTPLDSKEASLKKKNLDKNSIQFVSRNYLFILLNSILDPFNIILIGVSFLSYYLKDLKTGFIMAIMVCISAGIRFIQVLSSEMKVSDFTRIIQNKVTVIRKDNNFNFEESMNLNDCLPGDFVKLIAGDKIVADIQLIKANNLYVDQSVLTGESMPSEKFVSNSEFIEIEYNIDQNLNLNNMVKKNSLFKKYKTILLSYLQDVLGLDYSNQDFKLNSSLVDNFEKKNYCFMGTCVITGTGIGVVIATGKKTFFGQMSEKISHRKPRTAFDKGVRHISLIFIILILIIIIPIICIKGFNILNLVDSKKSLKERWIEAAQFALSVAVGLTPEMLPMILNSNLAKSSIQLSRKNCIVKNLEAIINLGSMNILCTDKTGTLTENHVSLCDVLNYEKQKSSITLGLAYLNSVYQSSFKNLTDIAIINAYEKILYSNEQKNLIKPELIKESNIVINKINEIPFDFYRRKVTVVFNLPENNIRLLVTKGAVNEMLDVCKYIVKENCLIEFNSVNEILNMIKNYLLLDLEQKEIIYNSQNKLSLFCMTSKVLNDLKEYNNQFNRNGYRLLVVAFRIEKLNQDVNNLIEEKNFIFAGFLTFINPPKKSSFETINSLINKGIDVKILSGDTSEVCENLCKKVGISTDYIINSRQLKNLDECEFKKILLKTVVFSQLTPIQKCEIVKALKKEGNVVGFLGDGINDAIALKEADIGISVDSGTEIAKDAADIILLEKELYVISDGVLYGRSAYINTLKYISMSISGNFGNVISLFTTCIWLPFLPMAPIHILLQNLLYDISQISIPWDNVDKESLKKPDVFHLKNIIIFMLFWGLISSIFDILTFLYLFNFLNIKHEEDNVNLFQTAWFTVGMVTQTLVVHFVRTHRVAFLKSQASLQVMISTFSILFFGLLIPLTPLRKIFNMAQLPFNFYIFLIFIVVFYCLLVESLKLVYLRLFHVWFTYI